MRLLTAILFVFFAGCKPMVPPPLPPSSYWEQQKGNFRYLNKTEFVSDSALRADLHNMKMSNHPIFRSITSQPVYLYSWQDRVPTTNEFTVIEDKGPQGLNIYYLTFNKKDSLIAYQWIAGQDDETVREYKKASKLSGRDTLLSIYCPISGYDPVTKKKFVPDWNDAYRFIIEKNGVFAEYITFIETPEYRTVINFWKDFSIKFKQLDTTFIRKHSLERLWFLGKEISTNDFFKNCYNSYPYFNLTGSRMLRSILDTNKTEYGTIGWRPDVPVKNGVRRKDDEDSYNCWEVIIRDTVGVLVNVYEFDFVETKTDYKLKSVNSYNYQWFPNTPSNPMVDTAGPEH